MTEMRNPAQLDLHDDPQASAREVARPVPPAIVEAAVNSAAHAAGCFFERRTSVTSRTPGSRKMPTTVCRGRSQDNDTRRRYAGGVWGIASRNHARFPPWLNRAPTRSQSGCPHLRPLPFYPHESPKTLHARRAHRAHLVLRPLGREGREEDAADRGALRGLFSPPAGPGGQRAELDRDPRRHGGARLRSQGAVNPHARTVEDTRTPEELLDLIEARGREVTEAIGRLREALSADRPDDDHCREWSGAGGRMSA